MEKDDLKKTFKQKKWIQKSTVFLQAMISKDAESGSEDGSDKSSKDDDESKSESGSGSESEKSEEDEESDESEDEGLKFTVFNKDNIKITKKKIERFTGTDGYQIITSPSNVKKFKVKTVTTKSWVKLNNLKIKMGVGVVLDSIVKKKTTNWDTGFILKYLLLKVLLLELYFGQVMDIIGKTIHQNHLLLLVIMIH
jgi:hypothetical protein